MEKKEIIYQLAKGIIEKFGRVRYSSMRRRLKKNISEIALYSAVADHIEENGIKPETMIESLSGFINELGDNPFAVRTNDEFFFLSKLWGDLSISNNPPEDLKFLCPYCYTILPLSKKSKRSSYSSACACCGERESRHSANESYKRSKIKKAAAPVVASSPVVTSEPLIEEVAENPIKQEPFIPESIPEALEPFITINNMMGNSSSGMDIELKIKFSDTMRFLNLINDFVIEESNKEDLGEKVDECASK